MDIPDLGVEFLNCLKCGTEVEEGQAFCPNCLRTIQINAATQDTVLVLPRRQDSASRRNTGKKRPLSVEEKLEQTRTQLRRCRILAAVLALIVVLLSTWIVLLILRNRKPVVGQNYSTVASSTGTGTMPTE